MFPGGGGPLGVASAAVNGPQPRSPRLGQCPAMKETWCASCHRLREVYSRVTAVHGEQSAAPVPSQQLPIPSSPPAQEAEV